MHYAHRSDFIEALGQSLKAASPADNQAKPLGQALSFMQMLWAVAHRLESASKHMHARLGVTGPQRLVLRLIGHHGRISPGALADLMHIHPSSLTGMLQRLEQAELIRRESDPFDRRRALLDLTRRGMKLNDERDGTIEATIDAALGRLTRERVTTAKAVLTAIADAFETEPDFDEAGEGVSGASSGAALRAKRPNKAGAKRGRVAKPR